MTGGGVNLVVISILSVFFIVDKLVFFPDLGSLNRNGWIGIFYSALPWILLGMIPLWTLGSRSRFVYWAFFPVAILFECVEWFTRINFNMALTGSWLGIFMASSPAEMKWFVGQYLSFKTLLVFLAIAALVAFVCWCVSSVRRARVSRLSLVAAGFAALLFVYGTNMPYGNFYETTRSLPAVHLVPSTACNFLLQRNLGRMKAHPQLPATIQRASANTNGTVTGVFVLGESDTRSHWELYGYPRATTPVLSSLRGELTVFSDLVTTDGATSDAMRSLFLTRTVERRSDVRYSIPQALRAAGIGAALYSRQSRWDGFDSDESYSFAGCDPFRIMGECGETNAYDSVLLKYLDADLAEAAGDRVVFLHLIGSHGDCRNNYPWKDLPFGADADKAAAMASRKPTIDDYDNSIWHTDKVLGEVIRRVRALRRPAWVIYLPDHGETPSSKSWRTATDLDLWNIPFVVWTSPEFNASYPERVAALRRAKDKPLQSDQLIYGLLRFMGVEGLGVSSSEDFLSDRFLPRRPRRIQGGDVVYPGDVR